MSQHDRARNEAEAADRLGVAAATLRNWRQQKVGPNYRKFGRSIRYLDSDLDEYIAASHASATRADRNF
jgi:predicted DNA-binding transcriptional regulator AlpA